MRCPCIKQGALDEVPTVEASLTFCLDELPSEGHEAAVHQTSLPAAIRLLGESATAWAPGAVV